MSLTAELDCETKAEPGQDAMSVVPVRTAKRDTEDHNVSQAIDVYHRRNCSTELLHVLPLYTCRQTSD